MKTHIMKFGGVAKYYEVFYGSLKLGTQPTGKKDVAQSLSEHFWRKETSLASSR